MNRRQHTGFTIVELLIVIIVIAILATITVVAYNGIQNRGRTSSGSANANLIAKKAEMFNSVNSLYPSYCQFTTNTMVPTGTTPTSGTGPGTCVAGGAAVSAEVRLDNVNMLTPSAMTGPISANGTVVQYKRCTTNGAQVTYYDFSTSGAITKNIGDTTTCP
jgi:prepilin-type N-terminal cleavage/methylation domain-containing protein